MCILKNNFQQSFLCTFKTKGQNKHYLPMPLGREYVDEALSSTVEVTLFVYEYHG